MRSSHLYMFIACAACAPAATTTTSTAPTTVSADASAAVVRPKPSNYNIITREEIVASNISNAWTLIQTLRPQYLRSRGNTTNKASVEESAYPNVYVDNQLAGLMDTLHNISVTDVQEIRYYPSSQVPMQYGSMNSNGVIALKTR